jgi:hypothetical protein
LYGSQQTGSYGGPIIIILIIITNMNGTLIKSSAGMSLTAAKRGLAGHQYPFSRYKNLDEDKVIATLPQPLQSLLHLRQLQKEMAANTAVKITKKNLEEHAKKLDAAYLDALNEYIGTTTTNMEEEDDDEDDDDDDEEDNVNNNNNKKKQREPVWDKDQAYARAQSLALLYRYSSPGMEQRTISEAYQKAVDQYVAQVSPSAGAGEDQTTTSV